MNLDTEIVDFDDGVSGDSITDYGKSENLSISEEKGNGSDEEDYIDKCVSKLQDATFLWNIVCNMDKEGNLHDFLLLMEQLSTGELPCNNIVLLLLLDKARFQKCRNTVGMCY